jgi:hypothetical protein
MLSISYVVAVITLVAAWSKDVFMDQTGKPLTFVLASLVFVAAVLPMFFWWLETWSLRAGERIGSPKRDQS